MTDQNTAATRRARAVSEFRTAMKWIVGGAVAMVAAALTFVGLTAGLSLHVVVATVLGVFFSFLLGAGLFALAFFSDKSGHDDAVTDATRQRPASDRE